MLTFRNFELIYIETEKLGSKDWATFIIFTSSDSIYLFYETTLMIFQLAYDLQMDLYST